jgi:hypothetical protein
MKRVLIIHALIRMCDWFWVRFYAEDSVAGDSSFCILSPWDGAAGVCGRCIPLRHDRKVNTHDGFPTLPCLWLATKRHYPCNRDRKWNIGLVLGKAENYFRSRIFYYGHSLETYSRRHPVQQNYITEKVQCVELTRHRHAGWWAQNELIGTKVLFVFNP